MGDHGDSDGETLDGPGESGDAGGPATRADRPDEASIHRCDYCRLPIPGSPITTEHDGVTYEFCSQACRTATEDHVFTEYHGFRRVQTGISAIDSSLPHGLPRNSLVLLTDLAGTRTEAIQAELVWRALQRGEPVVVVSFLEPPVSVVQEFVSLEWNVLPALEAGDLQIVDCFTYRVDDRDRMYERMNAWNSHLWEVAEQSTTTVRDPTDIGELQNRLDGALEAVDAVDRGVVVVDSLTELGSLVQPVQAYNFVKDVRADVCKGRFVPIFAGATVSADGEKFPHDLEYMVDGIVEMGFNEDIVEDVLVKQLRVRKMSGVLTIPEWRVYEYAVGEGLVTFDPVARMQAATAETDDGDQPPSEEGGDDVGDQPPADNGGLDVGDQPPGDEGGGQDAGNQPPSEDG